MGEQVQLHDLTFKLFIAEDQIKEKVQEIGQAITDKYRGQSPVFIGVLNGAFIFLADLIRACDLPVEVNFVKLASYSGTASTGKVQSILGLNRPIENRPIIIVEDIIDTGRTMHHFIPQLEALHPASIELASIFVKPTALQFPLKVDYTGFEIPDAFVVGYGLDYNQLGRNLKNLYQLYQQ